MDADEGVVLGVDTGGTFTDVFASDGTVRKVPSTPHMPADAIMRGIRALGNRPITAVAHGTTVATNSVLERKGARTALLTTAGFEDVLEIRRQNRPSMYDFLARWPDPLVPRERRLGVAERMDYQGNVLLPLDTEALTELIQQVGAESVAVCLLFSYANGEHERRLAAMLRRHFGDDLPVSLSCQVAPQYGEYERTSTTVINAFVKPVMGQYLDALQRELSQLQIGALHVMHSNGGLIGVRVAGDLPVLTILSGPAAGVVGAQALAAQAGHDQIITFDMGGTSTDVAVVPGRILESSEGEVATFPLLVPMLTIETVGAGGGSIARVDAAGGLHVGPESAGADPGPAAYGAGTLPTVTDANLVLGRLSPLGLLGGEMPLDVDRARAALAPLADSLGLSMEQTAWAVVRLANSNMERAVRAVTLQRGYDPRPFTLFPFGGAGPVHAAEMAEGLGVTRVLVPPHPGVMAALGLTVPDVIRDFYRTVLLPLDDASMPSVEEALARLEVQALAELAGEDLPEFGQPRLERAVDVRYVGQSFDLRVPYVPAADDLRGAFTQIYQRRYGYAAPGQAVEIVNVRVRAILPRLRQPQVRPDWPEAARPLPPRQVWFGSGTGVSDLQARRVDIHWRPSLAPDTVMRGPCIVEQYDSTTVVPPGWTARVDPALNLILIRTEP